jgi:hypothetical protein
VSVWAVFPGCDFGGDLFHFLQANFRNFLKHLPEKTASTAATIEAEKQKFVFDIRSLVYSRTEEGFNSNLTHFLRNMYVRVVLFLSDCFPK